MTEAIQARRRYTVEEYFRLERNSAQKHEFRHAEILDMAGGSSEHSLIIANFIGELRHRLKGSPCRVYESNLRVRLARSVQYTYPDASVICGEARFDSLDPDRRTVINPRVLIEVLSPSTELFDRGEKLRRYLEIESLEEYVMVSQTEPRVESLFRQPEGAWLLTTASGPDGIARLQSLRVDLPLSELYSGVEFPPQPELPQII